jgi:hypothetical protein
MQGFTKDIEPDILLGWIGGGLAAFVLLLIITKIIETQHTKNQKRSVTGIAVTTGLLLSISVSPETEIATALTITFDIIPEVYPSLIEGMLAVETVFGLIYGGKVMGESGGVLAILSFFFGLFGGFTLPIWPEMSVLFLLFGMFLMEISPADRW